MATRNRIAQPHQIYSVASVISSSIEQCTRIADAERDRWFNALAKASAQLLEGVRFEQDDTGFVFPSRTRTGIAHHVNGNCDCEAAEDGQPCWHRAAAKMLQLLLDANQGSDCKPEAPRHKPRSQSQRISQAQAQADIDELF